MALNKKVYVVLGARSESELYNFWNVGAYDNILKALQHAKAYNELIQDMDPFDLAGTDNVKTIYDPDMADINNSLEDKAFKGVKYFVQELEIR